MKIFGRKERKIANLEAKVKNRDILTEDQCRLIDNLKSIINSLEDDLKSSKEVSYELLKKLEDKSKAKRGRKAKEVITDKNNQ